jgi:hypothetical protein
MAHQDEHVYSDHPRPPHSAKFNSRRDNPHERPKSCIITGVSDAPS